MSIYVGTSPRRPLSDRTASGDRLPALDALRAIGAIAIVATHVGFWTATTADGFWGGVAARLDVGVAIFFVLSGFLLFQPFVRAAAAQAPAPDTYRYLVRRAVRILPAYWLAVTVSLIVLPQTRPVTGSDWAGYFTLTQIYQADWGRPGLTHTWSLASGAAFCLVLPLIGALVLRGRWRPVRAALLTIGAGVIISSGWIAAYAGGPPRGTLEETWPPTYAVWFAGGMTLAVMRVALATSTAPRGWQIVHRVGAAPGASVVLAGACLAIATTPIAGPRDLTPATAGQLGVRVTLFLFIAVLLVIVGGFGPPNRTKRALSSAPARWLGSVSYGLFLWHLPVLEAVYFFDDRPLFSGDFLDTFSIVLAGGVLLATISWYAIERPLLARTVPDGTLIDHGGRSGPAHDRHPERRDGEQPGQLRPGRDMVVLAHGEHAGHHDERERHNQLHQA
jgi:peptidoglycan/LPS O-acetylase OafA/YrhL